MVSGGGLGPRGTLARPPATLPGLVAQGAEVTLQAVAVGVGGLHPGHSGSMVPMVQRWWDTWKNETTSSPIKSNYANFGVVSRFRAANSDDFVHLKILGFFWQNIYKGFYRLTLVSKPVNKRPVIVGVTYKSNIS